ncbi:MAG: HNH endonuclease [Candidatus Micrarchaeia archaeon]
MAAKKYKDSKGYWHYADSGRAVHREVLRKKLGGTIHPGYDSHHIDGNKNNNRASNLWAVPHDNHPKAKKKGWW